MLPFISCLLNSPPGPSHAAQLLESYFPNQKLKPRPSVVKAQSPNRWTTGSSLLDYISGRECLGMKVSKSRSRLQNSQLVASTCFPPKVGKSSHGHSVPALQRRWISAKVLEPEGGSDRSHPARLPFPTTPSPCVQSTATLL